MLDARSGRVGIRLQIAGWSERGTGELTVVGNDRDRRKMKASDSREVKRKEGEVEVSGRGNEL